MINKDDVLGLYKDELATTAKVLKAIPDDQIDFKPHDRSGSVKDLFRTFIVELIMNMDFLKGEQSADSMSKIPEFSTVAEGITIYESKVKEFLDALEATPADDLDQPFSMWGMEGTRATIIFGMLRDLIHHRGQMSVYIRLSGGKVPSIYGPSADDNGGMEF